MATAMMVTAATTLKNILTFEKILGMYQPQNILKTPTVIHKYVPGNILGLRTVWGFWKRFTALTAPSSQLVIIAIAMYTICSSCNVYVFNVMIHFDDVTKASDAKVKKI